MGFKWRQALVATAVLTSVTFVGSSPAYAGYDDSFAKCSKFCAGTVRFVDYGEGQPGGGSNDDYIVCEDNSGVYVVGCWLWHNGVYQGGVVSSGDSAVVWEPYTQWNVKKGDTISIKVCLEVAPIDPELWGGCSVGSHTSQDG